MASSLEADGDIGRPASASTLAAESAFVFAAALAGKALGLVRGARLRRRALARLRAELTGGAVR